VPASWLGFLSPDFLHAFYPAVLATAKVFLVGSAGYIAVIRGWIKPDGLVPLGQLIAYVTLPAQVIGHFSQDFDPKVYPWWWKLVLVSLCVTIGGLALGSILGRRHKQPEATLLVGYQNAGFFVLPMLQALLPDKLYGQAIVLLFIFVIPFNASLWPVGSWLLLHKKEFDIKALVRPPTVAVVLSLLLFGLFHDVSHRFQGTPVWDLLFATKPPGAVQLIGDLTVPLATVVLGGSIAATARQGAGGLRSLGHKRAALEVALMKLVVAPVIGYVVLRLSGALGGTSDTAKVLALLLMLEFASPPAINIAVFCQQHNYKMKLIPGACLLCYILSLVTVPFWVAMVT
jgi:predicted permease